VFPLSCRVLLPRCTTRLASSVWRLQPVALERFVFSTLATGGQGTVETCIESLATFQVAKGVLTSIQNTNELEGWLGESAQLSAHGRFCYLANLSGISEPKKVPLGDRIIIGRACDPYSGRAERIDHNLFCWKGMRDNLMIQSRPLRPEVDCQFDLRITISCRSADRRPIIATTPDFRINWTVNWALLTPWRPDRIADLTRPN